MKKSSLTLKISRKNFFSELHNLPAQQLTCAEQCRAVSPALLCSAQSKICTLCRADADPSWKLTINSDKKGGNLRFDRSYPWVIFYQKKGSRFSCGFVPLFARPCQFVSPHHRVFLLDSEDLLQLCNRRLRRNRIQLKICFKMWKYSLIFQ